MSETIVLVVQEFGFIPVYYAIMSVVCSAIADLVVHLFSLWSCLCRSAIFNAGSVPLLAKLIGLDKEEFLIPIVGLAQECAVEVILKEKQQ